MADPFDVFKAFFNQRFGKSLAVKGNPGTGKTTFCLELASKMIGIQPVMYLSSRFTDEPLKDQFPFIEEVSYRFDPAKYAAHKTLKYVNTDHLEKLVFERFVSEPGRKVHDWLDSDHLGCKFKTESCFACTLYMCSTPFSPILIGTPMKSPSAE